MDRRLLRLEGIITDYGDDDNDVIVTFPTGYLSEYHWGSADRNQTDVSAHITVEAGPLPDQISFNRDDDINGNSPFA